MNFATSHPSLLFTVLGDNVPDFSTPTPKVTPGLHELDGSGPDDTYLTPHLTAALKRDHTYNGTSPLKVKFAQQLRYEADTSKIAYPASPVDNSSTPSCDLSPNRDADDKVSPTTSPVSEPPMKRRFSRMFSGRRATPSRPARVHASPTVDDAYVPYHAHITSTPRSVLVNAMFGIKKSRTRLRKASDEDESSDNSQGSLGKPKEFRLL